MKFKDTKHDRYYVNFMRGTEQLLKGFSTKEFSVYLLSCQTYEGSDLMLIDHKLVQCKFFLLTETQHLSKEFMVSKDGRIFYIRNLNEICELVDN